MLTTIIEILILLAILVEIIIEFFELRYSKLKYGKTNKIILDSIAKKVK